MKKLCSLLLCLFLCAAVPLAGLAERMYLIPDSNSRKLTEAELWEWDYESLGYVLNEIFARHGYNFEPGKKYDYYFRCMPWYTPNANPNNSKACYPQMNSVEWYNEKLIKDVRADMRAMGTTNPGGRSVWDGFSSGFDTLQGFTYATFKKTQKLPVYSAPRFDAYRGANGKASVSTNGAVMAAGWESGWLLVMYETNGGSVRVGYVAASDIKGAVDVETYLTFDYSSATVTTACAFTDDPARCYAPMATLPAGTAVTYLTTYFNQYGWDYIEATVNGQVARGFVQTGNLDLAVGVDGAGDDSVGGEVEG